MPQETPSSEIPAEDLEEVNKEQELEEGDNDEVPIEAIQNYGSDDVPDGNEQFMMEDEGDVTNEVTSKLVENENVNNIEETENQEVHEIHEEDDSESLTTNSKDGHKGMKDLPDHLVTKCGRAKICVDEGKLGQSAILLKKEIKFI